MKYWKRKSPCSSNYFLKSCRSLISSIYRETALSCAPSNEFLYFQISGFIFLIWSQFRGFHFLTAKTKALVPKIKARRSFKVETMCNFNMLVICHCLMETLLFPRTELS